MDARKVLWQALHRRVMHANLGALLQQPAAQLYRARAAKRIRPGLVGKTPDAHSAAGHSPDDFLNLALRPVPMMVIAGFYRREQWTLHSGILGDAIQERYVAGERASRERGSRRQIGLGSDARFCF